MLHKDARIYIVSNNLWVFADGMLAPILAVFTQKVGGSIYDISWAWAIYLIIAGVLTILVGKYCNTKARQEWAMVIGYFLNAFCAFSYLFVSTPIHLFIVQFGLGVAMALAGPTWSGLYGNLSLDGNHADLWGWATGQSKIFNGLAILAGGYVVANFSFNLLFIIIGTIHTFSAIYQAQILWRK